MRLSGLQSPTAHPRSRSINMATLEIWSNYQKGQASDHCTARITLEPKSIDKDATLSAVCTVYVNDTRAVNKSRVLFT